MAAAEVDVAFLATQVHLPELDIGMAVTAPTPESVCAIISAVVLRFRDLEQEKFQLGIELEGAYRSGESRVEQANLTRDKALKDLEEARQKAQSEGKNAQP
jgi:nucleoprotein TPR